MFTCTGPNECLNTAAGVEAAQIYVVPDTAPIPIPRILSDSTLGIAWIHCL